MESVEQEENLVSKDPIVEKMVNNDEEDLDTKVKRLEEENSKMREEFDIQRAKMKELFLQKEEEARKSEEKNDKLKEEIIKLQNELDEAKSQLVVTDLKMQNEIFLERRKAQDESASLQQIIDSTVDENMAIRRELETKINKLSEENNYLRLQIEQQSAHEGHPISVSTMTKSFAKKIASQLGADNDENAAKSKRHAFEDAEVLRSLVVPLEDEITALKEKLRTIDTELQKYKEEQPSKKSTKSKDTSVTVCDMCINYESQLQRIQMEVKNITKKLIESDQMLESQRQDLMKEVQFRKGMEEKWNEKKEEHQTEVLHLTSVVKTSKQILEDLKQQYTCTKEKAIRELNRLTKDREQVQRHLIELQQQNEYLMGKYSKNSEHYQHESINMPNTVDELHVSILKIREELIIATIAKEEAQKLADSLECELQLLHEQIGRINNEKEEKDKEIQHLLDKLNKSEMNIAELRQQITNLQQELNTGEQTQKDFVLLTQSLQIQLQKIRDSETEVRWQFEEDVKECPTCHISFSTNKKKEKVHCKHCGQIFCQSCLSNVVESGPNKRPTKVCNVCHTLLVQESAPFFSRDPP